MACPLAEVVSREGEAAAVLDVRAGMDSRRRGSRRASWWCWSREGCWWRAWAGEAGWLPLSALADDGVFPIETRCGFRWMISWTRMKIALAGMAAARSCFLRNTGAPSLLSAQRGSRRSALIHVTNHSHTSSFAPAGPFPTHLAVCLAIRYPA